MKNMRQYKSNFSLPSHLLLVNAFNFHSLHFIHICKFVYNFIIMHGRPIKNIELNDMHYEEESQLYSPRMQPQSSICSNNNLTPKTLEKCTFINQFQFNFLFQILQKPFSLRTHNEIRFINEFIKKNIALKELSDINGKDYCKGIMRTAVFEEFGPNDIIQEKGSEANTVYIILEGKVVSIKNDNETDMIEHINQREVYEILMNASRKQSKKISKLTRRFSSFREYNHRHHQKYDLKEHEQFLEQFEKGQSFGDKVRCFSKEFSHTFIALETTFVLSIDIKNVIFWLNRAFQLKLEKLSKILMSHPFFSHLDNEILEQIISYMSVHKRKKNETIYEQGQQASYIYFLEEGELKIEKQSHLFVDNPNELYMDRRKLMTSRERNNREYLPYANFEHLYNYRPINKTIELGILTPFALFGQQEIIENKRRQTTIRCSSLTAVFYSIEIKRIYQILNDQTTAFLDTIKLFIKDKIKYRQTNYATAINLQNKNNMKYFYYEGEQSLPTPRKYVIKKINQKINENTMHTIHREVPKELNTLHTETTNSEFHYVNPESRFIRQENIQKQFDKPIPPLYNTFNFHKMMKTKLIKEQLTKLTLQENDQQEISEPNKLEKLKMKEELKKEQKIIANSHTWRLVKEKVKQENRLSKKIGSYKYDINFLTPLIDNKHFQDIQTEMKRIQRQQKAGKFNVSVPKRNRTLSLNTIMMEK